MKPRKASENECELCELVVKELENLVANNATIVRDLCALFQWFGILYVHCVQKVVGTLNC